MASFATRQRLIRKPAHVPTGPLTAEKTSPAAAPTVQLSASTLLTYGQNESAALRPLVAIPLLRPNTGTTTGSTGPTMTPDAGGQHTDAGDGPPQVVRGVVQAQRAVKQTGTFIARERPTVGSVRPIQRKNVTGLPDTLKEGIEALSGITLDDVRVRYNSPKAAAVSALAYAQGTEIHVGPGQERHLPHEAWHTVQQKQGRVQPTAQAKGLPVNDDAALEREADTMGARASAGAWGMRPVAPAEYQAVTNAPIQRKIGFEFEMPSLLSALATPVTKEEKKKFIEQVEQIGKANSKGKDPGIKKDFTDKTDFEDVQRRDYLGTGELVDNKTGKDTGGTTTQEQMGDYRFHALSKKEKIVRGTGFTLEADEGNAQSDGSGTSVTEFVTDAFEEDEGGLKSLDKSLTDLETATKKIASFAGKRKVIHANEAAPGGLVGKVIFPTTSLEGVLQVTGAIDLARIPQLMKNMNAGEGETEKDKKDFLVARESLGSALGGGMAPAGPTGKAPDKAKNAVQDHKDFATFDNRNPPPELGSEELHGLVALIASYMMTANSANLGYAKTIAPIMARTDFATMFKMLNKEEKEYFTKDPEALVAIVEHATGLDMAKDIFPHGIYNDPRAKGAGDKDALKGLTRARWVTGIATGIDYLSAAKFNQNPDINPLDRSEKRGDLESMGALNTKTEKVGTAKKDAPLFEIRSLGQLATPGIMHQRALDIFKFLAALNEDKNAKF